MSLEARRKNKTAATSTTKEAKGTKKTGPEGPMRSIALGRSYLEFQPALDPEKGTPVARSFFDLQSHYAKAIGKDTSKDRVVNTSTLIRHLNATVFKQVFGVSLRGKVARMLVEGISDQVLTLVEKGYKVKMPNLAVFNKTNRKARKARNPRTGDEVQVPARITLSVKAARSAKVYLAQTGV